MQSSLQNIKIPFLPQTPYFEPEYINYSVKNNKNTTFFYSKILFSQLFENIINSLEKYRGIYSTQYKNIQNSIIPNNIYHIFVDYYSGEEELDDRIVIDISFFTEPEDGKYIICLTKKSGDDNLYKSFYQTIYNDLNKIQAILPNQNNDYIPLYPPYLKSFDKKVVSEKINKLLITKFISNISNNKNIEESLEGLASIVSSNPYYKKFIPEDIDYTKYLDIKSMDKKEEFLNIIENLDTNQNTTKVLQDLAKKLSKPYYKEYILKDNDLRLTLIDIISYNLHKKCLLVDKDFKSHYNFLKENISLAELTERARYCMVILEYIYEDNEKFKLIFKTLLSISKIGIHISTPYYNWQKYCAKTNFMCSRLI